MQLYKLFVKELSETSFLIWGVTEIEIWLYTASALYLQTNSLPSLHYKYKLRTSALVKNFLEWNTLYLYLFV